MGKCWQLPFAWANWLAMSTLVAGAAQARDDASKATLKGATNRDSSEASKDAGGPHRVTRAGSSAELPVASHGLEPNTKPSWLFPVVETTLLFTGMRATEAYLWPEPFAFTHTNDWAENYERAFTMPPEFDASRPFMTWDGDRWQINVIGHGLLGSELYLRPRRCGFGVLGSLGFAAVSSAVWEYGVEANGVRPSGVDLWFTPLSGLVLGEARLGIWRAAEAIRAPALRHLVQGLVDPIGEFTAEVFDYGC